MEVLQVIEICYPVSNSTVDLTSLLDYEIFNVYYAVLLPSVLL